MLKVWKAKVYTLKNLLKVFINLIMLLQISKYSMVKSL